MRSTFRPRPHMHISTHTITQANLRVDNIMEIRVLWCSKMTHKSCARARMQNTAVCRMDTNSRLMSGKLSYKYLSFCCIGDLPVKCSNINIFGQIPTQFQPPKKQFTLLFPFCPLKMKILLFSNQNQNVFCRQLTEWTFCSRLYIKVITHIEQETEGSDYAGASPTGGHCEQHWGWEPEEGWKTPWPAHQMGSVERVRWLRQLPALP